ncbi:MAG: hypothetical protein AVDCRST_MAG52-3317, partial [uncultured Blastococcus sp.]
GVRRQSSPDHRRWVRHRQGGCRPLPRRGCERGDQRPERRQAEGHHGRARCERSPDGLGRRQHRGPRSRQGAGPCRRRAFRWSRRPGQQRRRLHTQGLPRPHPRGPGALPGPDRPRDLLRQSGRDPGDE